jgi:hypothetical protein
MREPSLWEASKDPNIHSYRLTYFSPVSTREIVVRLDIHRDGGGRITSVVKLPGDNEYKRKSGNVSAEDVEGFLWVIERANFWSIPSTEQREARKGYQLDGSFWMLDGVRDGSFHYIIRRNPQPSPFTGVGRYLVKNLAKIESAVLSIPEYPSPNQ